MIKFLHILAVLVAIYSTTLLARTEDRVELKFFAFDMDFLPRRAVWLFHSWGIFLYYGGSLFLLKGYSQGWMKTVKILEKEIQVNNSNRWIILRGLGLTCLSLLSSLGLILIPTSQLRIDHIQFGPAAVIIFLTTMITSIWSRFAIKNIQFE